jgi:glycosyltransferase involved in cell wall biosynthesis
MNTSLNATGELTIVIPAKNEKILLPRLLESLLRQDYPLLSTMKVFVADANSTDGTPEIARSYADRLNISVIPGGLPAVGRNAGARMATSKYVLFIDADIELKDPSLLRRAVEKMNAKGLHCVTTNIHCRDGSRADSLIYVCNNIVQYLSRFHRPFSTGMFMMVDRQRFNELGGFDEKALYAEDYQLSRQFARRKFRCVRGGIYSTNRRFQKMGRTHIIRMFLNTALRMNSTDYYRDQRHSHYWQ